MLFKRSAPTWQLAKICDASGTLIGMRHLVARPPVKKGEFPWLAYLTFSFGGRPMPAPDKFDRFEKISASIEALEKTGEVAQVSMMMLNGKRDYILYCRDRERAARMLFDSFGHQGAQLEFMFDPKWSQFSDLHAMDVRK